MARTGSDDPVLRRFRAALSELYGDRIERVVLFGSRARGDAQEDSDYDIAVFLKDLDDRWREIHRIVPIVTDFLYRDEVFIHAMPYRAGSYRERTPLMHEIRREGIDLLRPRGVGTWTKLASLSLTLGPYSPSNSARTRAEPPISGPSMPLRPSSSSGTNRVAKTPRGVHG